MNNPIWTDKDLGVVSAFGVAKENGWTGTEAEWEALQAAAPQKASDAEAYAAGTRSGTEVESDDPAYHNNAAYYAEQAKESETAAEGSATSAAASAADALEHTQSVIETWLENNIDPETGYVLDRDLALPSAAAPADMVGDLKSAITDQINFEGSNQASILVFTQGGYFYISNHNFNPVDGWGYTDLYPCDPSTDYYLNVSANQFIYFFDSSKNYISGVSAKFATAPATAAYIQFAIQTAYQPVCILTKGKPYSNYVDSCKNAIKEQFRFEGSNQVIPLIFYNGGFFYPSTYQFNANDAWGYTDLIPCDPLTEYFINTPSNQYIYFFDSSKAFLQGFTAKSATSPATAAYIQIAAQTSLQPQCILTKDTEYMNYVAVLKSKDDTKSSVENNMSMPSYAKSIPLENVGYISSNGTVTAQTSGSNRYSDLIPISRNAIIKYNVKATSSLSCVAFYASDLSVISTVPGDSSSVAYKEGVITSIPTNAAFIRVASWQDSAATPRGSATVFDVAENVFQAFKPNYTFSERTITSTTEDKYIRANGSYGDFNGYEIIKASVEPGKIYAFKPYVEDYRDNLAVFRNIEGYVLRGKYVTPYNYFFRFSDDLFFVYAPQKATTIEVNVIVADNPTPKIFEVIPANEFLIPGLKIRESDFVEPTKYKYWDSLKKPFNFSGKTITAFGDSITYGVGSPNLVQVGDKSYIKQFAAHVNATLTNLAVSGSTLSHRSDTDIVDKVEAYTGTPDFIIISGGVNDWSVAAPLGTFGSTDNTTVYGALKLICESLKTHQPNSTIIFITPVNVTRLRYTTIADLSKYRDAIYEVATAYGYNVVDGSTIGLPSEPGDWADLLIDNDDGVHPTELGHTIYYHGLCGKLL